MMRIPRFRRATNAEEEAAMLAVLRSGQLAAGPGIELFEQELAAFVGARDAAAVSSGFASLHLALLALGVGPGDEVILPCVSTCAAIRNAVLAAGATPVFADTTDRDFNLDAASARSKMSRRTRAIIAPHHTGVLSSIEELNALGVPVIEDCAQALGTGAGALSVFSFYPTKLLTTIDGGAVASNDAALVARVRDLRYYSGSWDATLRYNYKMQNLGAVLGRVELRHLAASLERRRAIGERYRQVVPAGMVFEHAVYFRFAFRTPNAAAIREALEKDGIPCRPEVGFLSDDAFPNATRVAAEVVTLPTYPALTDEEVEYVAGTLHRVLERRRPGG